MPVDPFTLLEKDHRVVEHLLDQLGDSEEGSEREAMVSDLELSLSVHMSYEEKKIYPLVVREIDAETAEEAEIEHGLARDGLAKLRELVAAPGFGAAVEMLKGGIGHHVEEEESEIFPEMRQQLDSGVLEALTDALVQAKADAGLPPVDPSVATKDELLMVARRAGLDVTTSMTKDELKAAVVAAH